MLSTLRWVTLLCFLSLGADPIHSLVLAASDNDGTESTPPPAENPAGSGKIGGETAPLQEASPPTITITGVDDGGFYPRKVTPQVSVSGARPFDTIITLNGSPYLLNPLSAEDRFTLSVTATDRNGRQTVRTLQFTIDRTPPVISIKNVVDGNIYTTEVTPSITITDANLLGSTITLDGSPFDSETVIRDEGTHTLTVTAEDRAGNKTASTVSFTIDRTPPVSMVEAGVPQFVSEGIVYITGRTPLTVTARDEGKQASGVDTIECRTDGSPKWVVYDRPITLAGFTDGVHTLTCRSTDRAGNVEQPHDFVVTIDNTQPSTELIVGTPGQPLPTGGFAATASTPLSLRASDLLSGVASTEYRVDNGAWQPYTPFSISSEGKHTIDFRSIDHLGNREAFSTAPLIIDKSSPLTRLTAGTPSYNGPNDLIFVTPATTFTLAVDDTLTRVAKTEYRIDNGPWIPYSPFAFTGDGQHRIEYRSTDSMGNQEEAQFRNVTVDSKPPLTTISLGQEQLDAGGQVFINKKSTFTLASTDNLAGVASTEYRIDRGRWIPYAPFTVDAQRSHAVSFRSRDKVGNLEEAKTITVRVDKTPPKTTISVGQPKTTAAKGILYANDSSIFTLTASDGQSGVNRTDYRVDGGPWTSYEPFTVHGDGNHLIEYRSSDKAGNQETPHQLQVTIFSRPPTTILSAGSRSLTKDTTIFTTSKQGITLTATKNLWGEDVTEYKKEGGPWTVYTSPISFATEGSNQLEFRSRDKAGNQEPPRTVTVTTDNTPPVSTLTIGTPKREADGKVYVNSGTVFVPNATDNLAGVDTIEYRIAGSGTESDALPFGIGSNGTFTIEYWSTDKAGNAETPHTMTVVVDNSLPVIYAADGKPGIDASINSAIALISTEPLPVKMSVPVKEILPAVDTGQTVAQTAPAVSPQQDGAKPADGRPPTDAHVAGAGATALPPFSSPLDEGAVVLEPDKKSKFYEYLGVGLLNFVIILGIMLL